jgi:hypothetical protein
VASPDCELLYDRVVKQLEEYEGRSDACINHGHCSSSGHLVCGMFQGSGGTGGTARGCVTRRAARPTGTDWSKGEAGSLGLHVLNHDCSGDKCDLACDAGEKLASVTCPGGTIGLTKTGDTETASCTNTSGPILAICVRQ